MFNLRNWFGVIPVFTLVALLISAATTQIPKIENTILSSAQKILANAQQPWVKVEVNGQELVISGVAPTQELKEHALSLIADVKSVSAITETITVQPPEKPYIFSVSKTNKSFSIGGAVPKRNVKSSIIETIRSSGTDIKIDDKTHFASGLGDSSNWMSGVNFMIAQLNRMENGEAKLIDGQYEISSVTTTLENYDSIQAAFQQIPDGFKVISTNIAITKPNVYKFEIEKVNSVVKLAGFAPSLLAKQDIITEIQKLIPNSTVVDQLRIAQGAPASFNRVISSAISSLSTVPNGQVLMENDTVSIKAVPEKYEQYEVIQKSLLSLGNDIKLNVKDLVVPVKIELQAFSVNWLENTVELSGELSENDHRTNLLNVIQTLKPSNIIDKSTTKQINTTYNYAETLRNILPAFRFSNKLRVDFLPNGVNIKLTALDMASYNLAQQYFSIQHPQVLDVKITPPLQKPFKWSLIKDNSIVEITGYVPSTEVRTQLLQSLRNMQAGNSIIDTMSLSGTDLNSDEWGVITKFAIQLSGLLKKAKIELVDFNLTISGRANSTADYLQANELILKAQKTLIIKSIAIEPPASANFHWKLDKRFNVYTLSGNVRHEQDQKSFTHQLRQLSGKDTLIGEWSVEGGAPIHFQYIAQNALKALSLLQTGSVVITPETVMIQGDAHSELVITKIDSLLNAVIAPAGHVQLTNRVKARHIQLSTEQCLNHLKSYSLISPVFLNLSNDFVPNYVSGNMNVPEILFACSQEQFVELSDSDLSTGNLRIKPSGLILKADPARLNFTIIQTM